MVSSSHNSNLVNLGMEGKNSNSANIAVGIYGIFSYLQLEAYSMTGAVVLNHLTDPNHSPSLLICWIKSSRVEDKE